MRQKDANTNEEFEIIKYKENPFLDDLVINKKSKQVRVTNGNSLGDNVLVNQKTGEVSSTNVVTYKQVDDEEFVKLFTANIALTFDLTSAGIKAFNVLLFSVQKYAIKRDLVQIDEFTLEDFLSENDSKKCSKATLYRGIKELIKSKIIAKTMKAGFYFLNPHFAFNGDRISFTTAIERRKKKVKEKPDK